jgi:hypothetical protein
MYPGPGANDNSKFVYTEDIVATDLALTFRRGLAETL